MEGQCLKDNLYQRILKCETNRTTNTSILEGVWNFVTSLALVFKGWCTQMPLLTCVVIVCPENRLRTYSWQYQSAKITDKNNRGVYCELTLLRIGFSCKIRKCGLNFTTSFLISPLQLSFVPFPVKPCSHWHWNDPIVFVHVALSSHRLIKHSSWSE